MTNAVLQTTELDRKNKRIMGITVGAVAGMIGLAYASVPLYDWFCRVTGFGGTTQVAETEADAVLDRAMKIRFDASTARGMPWAFQPVEREVSVQIGENGLAFYRATNRTARTVTGTATFNVTPLKAGQYFAKMECFCFTEQVLEPGQSVDMPVAFYVDPEIANDPNLDEVKTITLSYTFFEVKPERDESDQLAALEQE